ncbi:dynein heavy chain 1, cytosolic [Puccinia graminis f. sp. tritici CRL 75-36-700-3]|uniref:Dynein heavy chain 1, cytosolic n=1 Tax=Puccinia graminis f. sp. tritici (strain CRL 75-36-700-3 / race SCCL) TaxID=418459 RepID=H6QRI0_PUCGT|nr:dynein heavy chain 1, cytosolic [Puccinia graminis f. sp. tritici CRL 75-36-700-3]EHS63264.1 dynein heavy chain 1, cytosolic [Puccinia graminis f. sp. tritici CRL 75-36-700-3]
MWFRCLASLPWENISSRLKRPGKDIAWIWSAIMTQQALSVDETTCSTSATFKEEATIWTHRLNRMSEIFEKWIDVQRQWVYFEAIFSGNTDIKHRLPNASNQFNMIHTKYLGLMKHVSKSPYIVDELTMFYTQRKTLNKEKFL